MNKFGVYYFGNYEDADRFVSGLRTFISSDTNLKLGDSFTLRINNKEGNAFSVIDPKREIQDMVNTSDREVNLPIKELGSDFESLLLKNQPRNKSSYDVLGIYDISTTLVVSHKDSVSISGCEGADLQMEIITNIYEKGYPDTSSNLDSYFVLNGKDNTEEALLYLDEMLSKEPETPAVVVVKTCDEEMAKEMLSKYTEVYIETIL